jgi:chromosome segregation ATPase
MSPTTTAITVQEENEVQALSKWDALASDISIATEESQGKEFDYHDKSGNKEARSYVYSLRKLKTRIEKARKEAKSVHLERGRQVDETARLLESAVQGLIEPHEREIKAIEAAEQARIDAHKSVLDRIASLVEGVSTSDEAQARLLELALIDTSALEEFSTAGANRQAEATEQLESLRDALQVQEAERAELEALRAEKAEREKQQERERIRQEVIQEIQVETKQAPPVASAPVYQPAAAAPVVSPMSDAKLTEILVSELCEAMAGREKKWVAMEIANGTLHPAITVNLQWRESGK